MSDIHPTAIVGRDVQMGVGNRVGPHVVIEEGVRLGSHNTLYASSYLCRGTEIGSHNEIHMGAIIGHAPQDLAYEGAPTRTKIGDHNQIREYVTIHRGTKPETATVIGNENFLMAYSHIAHNCQVGNKVIMVNQASLAGYCIVEDQAFLSGMTAFHQFTRIGRLAMVSALSASNKDIPPFVTCGGRPALALGVNLVGLRRAGIPEPVRSEIKQAFRYLYRSELTIPTALERIKAELKSAEVQHLVCFIESSKRGIISGAKEGEEIFLARKNADVID